MEQAGKLWIRIAVVVGLLVVAAAAGLGTLMANRFALTPSLAPAESNVMRGAGMEIHFPAPVREYAGVQEATSVVPVVAAASVQPSIIPGGAIEGGAVDRMWETNVQQAWQVRSQPLTPQNWYITGVVQRGAKTQVIVQFDGEPMPRFFNLGDTLPGGSKLSWVRPDAIGVVTANRKSIDVPVLSGEISRTVPSTLSKR